VVALMDQCGICIYSQFFGDGVGPSWKLKFCTMHYGLLECLFGWVFHSDSVSESDGYLWWWWWLYYTILYYTILYYTILYYTILYFRETFDIEILLSQIIIICCACSVDRAFGILFRKNCTIYRFYHILYFCTYFIL
jgi:hypothetical protein